MLFMHDVMSTKRLTNSQPPSCMQGNFNSTKPSHGAGLMSHLCIHQNIIDDAVGVACDWSAAVVELSNQACSQSRSSKNPNTDQRFTLFSWKLQEPLQY